MTSIVFHFNVSDRNSYVCRLARKGVSAGAKLLLLVHADELARVDNDLWQWSPTQFVPHCLPGATKHIAERSPVVLTSHLALPSSCNVLINLCDQVPDGFANFERVIEVVGLDDPSRQASRQRWRQYAQAGVELVRHDAQARGMT